MFSLEDRGVCLPDEACIKRPRCLLFVDGLSDADMSAECLGDADVCEVTSATRPGGSVQGSICTAGVDVEGTPSVVGRVAVFESSRSGTLADSEVGKTRFSFPSRTFNNFSAAR